jgi:putative membrane protein
MLTSLTLASHGWHHGGPGPWIIFPIVFLVVALVLLFRWSRWGRCHRGGPGGMAVLAERYARGEIDEAEYRSRRAVLRDRRG